MTSLQKTRLQKITAIWRGHGQKALIWIRLINPEITQQRKKGYGSVRQEKKKEMVAPVFIMASWEGFDDKTYILENKLVLDQMTKIAGFKGKMV